jgi:hypothetical protein
MRIRAISYNRDVKISTYSYLFPIPHMPGEAAPHRPQPGSADMPPSDGPATAKTDSCFSMFEL